MPLQYAVSYLLLALLTILALTCLASALSLLRPGLGLGKRPAEPAPVAPVGVTPSFRRCEECSARWRATEDDHPSERTLRRQRTRRRTRRLLLRSGSRRLPPSWDRCPHCLSTAVRASRSARGSRSAG